MAKILAIDDEQTCLEVIKFSLNSRGFDVVTASSGMEGLAILKQIHAEIDLILLDIMMPGMCGLKTLEKMQEISDLSDKPVIVQTGTSNYDEIQHYVNLGYIANVLRKPYNREQLISLINLELQKKEQHKMEYAL